MKWEPSRNNLLETRFGVEQGNTYKSRFTEAVLRVIGRYTFGTACGIAFLCALVFLFYPPGLDNISRLVLVGSLMSYAGLCAWWTVRSVFAHFALHRMLLTASLLALFIVMCISIVLHMGLQNPMFGLIALLVSTLCAVTRVRMGSLLAISYATSVFFLAWLTAGKVDPYSPQPTPDIGLLVWMHLVMIASSIAVGTLIAKVLRYYLESAGNRQKRFQLLLGMAVEWYWEQDKSFHFTYFSDKPRKGGQDMSRVSLGRTLWDIEEMALSPQALQAHRADLQAHRSFSRLLVTWRSEDQQLRYIHLSGEPRFTRDDQFDGYWGVGHDVTHVITAQKATLASEARYRDLFARSPTALLLHRDGTVIDANQAAIQLFDFNTKEEMIGYRVADFFATPQARELSRTRMRLLDQMPDGEGIPVVEFQLTTRTGRHISAQGTGVKIAMPDGAATLSIFLDITERAAAEAAYQRSSTMLRLLIATSPDCITVTDLTNDGGYTMVNETFTKLTGYSSEEVLGKTYIELGIWDPNAEQQEAIQSLKTQGSSFEIPATFKSKKGGIISMLLSGARFEMDGQDYMVINARDVTLTERVRLEHAAMLRNASIGIALTRSGVITQANPRFEQIFGWPEGMLLGRSASIVWPTQDAFKEATVYARPLLLQGRTVELEQQMKRRNGSLFWCRILGQVIDPAAPSRAGTIWITEDISERRLIADTLAAARDAAETANRAKSAFLANTSHEIRTPLNGILGLAKLAGEFQLDEGLRQQYLDQIMCSAENLSRIISDILDVSKIEAGKLTIETVAFNLHETLRKIHHSFAVLAHKKALHCSLKIDPAVPKEVMGDPLRVRQIVSNYASNAIKFTEQGFVEIHVQQLQDGSGVEICVNDSGPGIPLQIQSRLFTPFTQADESITRRYGGTGLGLSICKELAGLMGGEVGVRNLTSERYASGSQFWVRLPLQIVSATDVNSLSHDPARCLQGYRVLLVEDNPVNMLISATMLVQWGFHVTQAETGQLAIEQVHQAAQKAQPFDLVLMDVQMPEMSGYETTVLLRQYFDSQTLPIIALTAAALISEREEALHSGMNDFLTKPIDREKLQQTMLKFLVSSSAPSTVL
jgi:PAS domain S-box-containing protein